MARNVLCRGFWVLLGAAVLVGALVAPAAAKPSPWSPPGAGGGGGDTTAQSIDICCTWGTGILDGVTYTIVGTSDPTVISAIEDGIHEWEAALNGDGPTASVSFVESPADPEVTIRYKRGGGTVAGSTQRSSTGGFISGASMSISGKAFGQDALATMTTVTAHEWGHVLGLNHADGTGELMSPTLDPNVTTIQPCDLAAAETALAWYLSGASTPVPPATSSQTC